jgi:hypothetical protein
MMPCKDAWASANMSAMTLAPSTMRQCKKTGTRTNPPAALKHANLQGCRQLAVRHSSSNLHIIGVPTASCCSARCISIWIHAGCLCTTCIHFLSTPHKSMPHCQCHELVQVWSHKLASGAGQPDRAADAAPRVVSALASHACLRVSCIAIQLHTIRLLDGDCSLIMRHWMCDMCPKLKFLRSDARQLARVLHCETLSS